MSVYKIFEDNLPRLEKKLKTIQNKCVKRGNDFKYEQVGEVFEKVLDIGSPYASTHRFVLVDVKGTVRQDNWIFVASIDHHEGGNVVRAFEDSVPVPERYYHSSPVCEHCNTSRRRASTYLIFNTETHEYKQVGKSCLKEFTCGLDAEYVASYISLFDDLIEGEAVGEGFHRPYYSVDEILRYSFETIKHFGYTKSGEPGSTVGRVFDYWEADNRSGDHSRAIAQMKEVRFNQNASDNVQNAADAIKWVKSSEDRVGYMANLRAIFSSEWFTGKDAGFVVSAAFSYLRHVDELKKRAIEEAARKAKAAASDYVGQVKDRITFKVSNARLVSFWEGQFGYTYLYEFIDDAGHVLTWFASSGIELERDVRCGKATERVSSVTGTVKAHQDYKGVKQTVLTRCRVAYEMVEPDCNYQDPAQALDMIE